jgi:hypothetical protein
LIIPWSSKIISSKNTTKYSRLQKILNNKESNNFFTQTNLQSCNCSDSGSDNTENAEGKFGPDWEGYNLSSLNYTNYSTFEMAKSKLYRCAENDGVNLIVYSSSSKRKVSYFVCRHYGEINNWRKLSTETRKKKTNTMKTNCLFKASITNPGDNIFRINILYSYHHGHYQNEPAFLYPKNRELTENQTEYFHTLINSRNSNQDIFIQMKDTFPQINSTIGDFKSKRRKFRKAQLNNHS